MLWKHEVVGSSPAYPTNKKFGCDICEVTVFGPPWVLTERIGYNERSLWLCSQCGLEDLRMMFMYGGGPSSWYVVDARLGVD